MGYLLDTHTVLYFLAGDKRLPLKQRELLDDSNLEKLFSLASIWEIAIKQSIGKLQLDVDLDFLPRHLLKWNIREFPIELPHLAEVSRLPLYHRDPFDRLLVAQCLVEGFSIVSNDLALDAYGVQRIW